MSSGAVVAKAWSDFTPDEAFDMAKLRSDVFFLEQRITEEELDYFDRLPETMHYWVPDAAGFAAYLRVVVDESMTEQQRGAKRSIGRVVVRPDRRGDGLAKLLMMQAIADWGEEPLALHAQVYIARLYREFGFVEYGDEFDEAGIAHIMMFRPVLH